MAGLVGVQSYIQADTCMRFPMGRPQQESAPFRTLYADVSNADTPLTERSQELQ
jgi:hypothetical protein